MPKITLPDGSVLSFDRPVTGMTIAESIGSGLARAALAMKVDGVLCDMRQTLRTDATVHFITRKERGFS